MQPPSDEGGGSRRLTEGEMTSTTPQSLRASSPDKGSSDEGNTPKCAEHFADQMNWLRHENPLIRHLRCHLPPSLR